MDHDLEVTPAAVVSQKERGPVSFPPPLVFLAGLGLGWVAERFEETPNLPAPWWWLALGAGVVGFVALDSPAVATFLKKRTGVAPWTPATTLVTDGIYRITRNPMYLGMTLLYLGLALGLGWMWALALLPVVVAIIDRAVIRREEAYLQERFGPAYTDYRASVRRWI